MAHNHSHDHNHNHDHVHELDGINNAYLIGIALNFLFVVIEVVIGLRIHSLSLLSDAGHNLADVAALGLSLLAFKLAEWKPTLRYTYGLSKTSILVALFNAMVLMVSIGAITYEAIQRFLHPEPLPGGIIAAVAAIGIVINASSALLFFRKKGNDLNIRGAYLHLASDALVSLALVIGGILIFYTHLYWIDAVLSIVVAGVIVASTWRLLTESLRLSLDGVPQGIVVDDIILSVKKINGVTDLHHVHAWALSTTVNALTAHLVLLPETSAEEEERIKAAVKHHLLHLNIHHATLETERSGQPCKQDKCQD